MSKKKIVSAGLTALMLGTQVAPVVAATKKDVTAPVVGLTATKDGGKVTVSETSVVTVNYYKDGQFIARAYLNKKLAKGAYSWAKKIGAGNWTVKVWAKDLAGNTTVKSLAVKVAAPAVKTAVSNLAVTQSGDVATFNFDLNQADKANVEVNLLPNIPATVAVVDGVKGANSVTWNIDKSVVNGTYNVKVKAGDSFVTGTLTIKRVAANLAVDKVEAVDAKTIKVTFNKEVDKATVFANESAGTLTNAFAITGMGSAPAVTLSAAKATLSADATTLTIVAGTTEIFNGQYAITIASTVKDKTAKALTAYSGVFTNVDTVRPVISGPTYTVNSKATFTASEPVQPGTVAIANITDEAGVVSTTPATVAVASDNKSFTVDLSGFTVDKNYKVTFVGIKDFAGNLITPNPVTFTVKNTKVDSVAPTVTNIEATKVGEFKVTFSEKVTTFNYTVDGLVAAGTFTLDSTGTVATVTDATRATAGAHLIAVTGAVDASGISQTAAYSKFVQFNADVVAPTYVSHEVKTISGKQYLAVKYSETVAVTGASLSITGTKIDANQVTSAITPISVPGANVTVDTTDKTLLLINLTDTGLVNANYTLNLPAALAYDGTNGSAAKVVSFSVGATPTTADTTKPGVSTTTVQTTADAVTITFSENVAAATALNVANYTVEGQAVFESAILDGAQNKVTLKLKANAITVTGNRVLTIKNVTDVAGNVMDEYNTTVNFIENVKPVVTSAKLTANNQITVTFSEAVANVDGTDFLVKVAGVGNTITGVSTTNASTYVVSFTTPISDLSKAIALTVQGTNNIVDTTTPANALATTGDVTVTQ